MSDVSINTVLAQMRAVSASAHLNKSEEPAAAQAGGLNFSNLLKDSLEQVNELQANSSAMKAAIQTGSSDVSLPEVMVAVQKASLSFEAITQVRNKLLSAYQEIMNMPV